MKKLISSSCSGAEVVAVSVVVVGVEVVVVVVGLELEQLAQESIMSFQARRSS